MPIIISFRKDIVIEVVILYGIREYTVEFHLMKKMKIIS